ncbi:MAG: DUF2854 domain-containing protein [Synechococcaceae bacterium WB4_2_0811]|jgi:hypothetical protein|nr:DUF2854 domain-containing protein [Synechococcaceae bacterium WB4_2_0811]
MQAILSPGSLLTVLGSVLTVIGSIAYATDAPNLSLPTIFYGIPIFLGGLALKSSELPPVRRLTAPAQFQELRDKTATEGQLKLLKDVVRWRYGQKAHLESSLEALKLWDEDNPPQLESIEEYNYGDRYALRLQVQLNAVDRSRWFALEDRLGRFFGPGLEACLDENGANALNICFRQPCP